MKALLPLSITVLLIASISYFAQSNSFKKMKALHGMTREAAPHPAMIHLDKLKGKAADAKTFIRKKGYNNQYCFFIDMSLPSGENRFFIYSLEKDSLLHSGLVTHGNCFQNWLEGRKYGNEVGCGCTSLGKYKIGIPYTGKWGYAYKLHGLDSSNSNAFERAVVLHSHSCVPETEQTDEICQSNGCPTVSPGMLNTIKPLVNQSGKPVLLWMYE